LNKYGVYLISSLPPHIIDSILEKSEKKKKKEGITQQKENKIKHKVSNFVVVGHKFEVNLWCLF